MKRMKRLRGEERGRGGVGVLKYPTRRPASSFLIEASRQCYRCSPEEFLPRMADSSFRVQARYVLLTYAQCGDLDEWRVHDVITSFPAECLIARETHADGGIHLHAFVDFGRRVDIRNPRRFDVDGHHPNIQPCGRTPQKMLDYAIKDGDIVAGGLSPVLEDPIPRADDVWSRIAHAPTVDEFWDLVRELAPRTLCCNFNSLRAYAEWHYRPPAVEYQHPASVRLSTAGVPELDEWVRDNLSGAGR